MPRLYTLTLIILRALAILIGLLIALSVAAAHLI